MWPSSVSTFGPEGCPSDRRVCLSPVSRFLAIPAEVPVFSPGYSPAHSSPSAADCPSEQPGLPAPAEQRFRPAARPSPPERTPLRPLPDAGRRRCARCWGTRERAGGLFRYSWETRRCCFGVRHFPESIAARVDGLSYATEEHGPTADIPLSIEPFANVLEQ